MSSRSKYATREEINDYFREYREKNREKLRKYNRDYNKKYRKENGYANEINSAKKYPEKQLARNILQRAVRNGKIVRGNCEVCNLPNAQAHHDDYSKPLEVKWFCALHHREYENKQKLNENKP